ncbi:hypothetical protein B0H10DRAFT_1942625 [Mycena sp. CBHHK59/15]|nr:hypothetical protein B0H10DRAFT_1942625 [Mycena sp. CBHHK59/15]
MDGRGSIFSPSGALFYSHHLGPIWRLASSSAKNTITCPPRQSLPGHAELGGYAWDCAEVPRHGLPRRLGTAPRIATWLGQALPRGGLNAVNVVNAGTIMLLLLRGFLKCLSAGASALSPAIRGVRNTKTPLQTLLRDRANCIQGVTGPPLSLAQSNEKQTRTLSTDIPALNSRMQTLAELGRPLPTSAEGLSPARLW